MKGIFGNDSEKKWVELIEAFVLHSKGLTLIPDLQSRIGIKQSIDSKHIEFAYNNIAEVIERKDNDGSAFLQINFENRTKILLTQSLIGFKPVSRPGLDINRLPKVVTTPDLISVIDAIEECFASDQATALEIETLKKVYDAVVFGAEAVGFDLAQERGWIRRMVFVGSQIPA